MKYECVECESLFNENNIILGNFDYAEALNPLCTDCYYKIKKNKQ